MVLRYISAKDPTDLTAFVAKMKAVGFVIISGPDFVNGRWYLWLSGENHNILKDNIDL